MLVMYFVKKVKRYAYLITTCIRTEEKDIGEYHDFEPPTKTTVLSAVHLCPAAPNPAATSASKVAPMHASGMIIA